MQIIARVVGGLVVGTVIGLFFVGVWPLFWYVWGAVAGLIIARWWAVAFALLAFPPTWFINSVLGTRGEGQEWGVAQEVLWPMLATTSAGVGIAAGVGVALVATRFLWPRAQSGG